MRARNTKTGEVVDNFGFSKEYGTISYTDKNGTLTVTTVASGEWEIIDDKGGNFDWFAFRREAAKDILAGFAANSSRPLVKDARDYVEVSIKLADELIKKLKEGKK